MLTKEAITWFESLPDSDKDAFMAEVVGALGDNSRFASYQFRPHDYVTDFLDCVPWDKQAEILDAYALALRQLHERDAWEKGEIATDDLEYWQPGQVIQNWIAVDAGHNVGKTWLMAKMVSHFFDCFEPSIIYCFAPTAEQINDLLFKEIRTDRRGRDLPGEVMEEPRIKYRGNHFIKGKATDNSKGTGTEKAQGQHGKYLMFVLDEAEGIPAFIWDAVRSMASGGIAIVLISRNPRTTTCEAHKIRRKENTVSFRISCLEHPNVLEDKEVIPGSVRRQYIYDMLDGCDITDNHNADERTFELPWQPGVIYRPSISFMWRVLGLTSTGNVDDTFCPIGRYEAAQEREPYSRDDPAFASIGVDAARYGNDNGTIYYRHAGVLRKDSEIVKKDGYEYYIKVKDLSRRLASQGVKRCHVRLDAGGGYHSTCTDNLNRDADLKAMFEEFRVIEVHNNGTAHDDDTFADRITELYYHTGQALKVLRLERPPAKLEVDLCERKFKYVIKTAGDKTRLDLKQLVSKEKFRDDFGYSPDDGDGAVLAAAPEYIFKFSSASFDSLPQDDPKSSRWKIDNADTKTRWRI